MEKFLLSTFLSYNKLDIIDEEHIIIPIFLAEFCCGDIIFIPDGVDQFVGKFF